MIQEWYFGAGVGDRIAKLVLVGRGAGAVLGSDEFEERVAALSAVNQRFASKPRLTGAVIGLGDAVRTMKGFCLSKRGLNSKARNCAERRTWRIGDVKMLSGTPGLTVC
jgi:hypothetical protein